MKTPVFHQVTLVGDTPSKAQYDVIDEHRCSLSLLNSTDCAKTFPTIYPSDGIMRRDTEYIEGEYNKKCGRSGCVKDIESEPENFYKCHVGAVTAAENCKIPEIDSEAKCRYVEDDSCVGFVASSLSLIGVIVVVVGAVGWVKGRAQKYAV